MPKHTVITRITCFGVRLGTGVPQGQAQGPRGSLLSTPRARKKMEKLKTKGLAALTFATTSITMTITNDYHYDYEY